MFNGLSEHLFKPCLIEIHFLDDDLEAIMDDISDHKWVTKVGVSIPESIRKQRFSDARERVDNIGRRNHDFGFKNDELGLVLVHNI